MQALSGQAIDSPSWHEDDEQPDLFVGQARQEIKDGKSYYVVPFQQSFRHNIVTHPDLGFLFYSMLHIPAFLAETGEFNNLNFNAGSLLESSIIEGPVNTEIVFKNGKTTTSREVFSLPSGRIWEGSVHLHAAGLVRSGRPIIPSGYAGDGGYGENKGWMVGERHAGSAQQPRLALYMAPNNKIQDFRSSAQAQETENIFLALGVDSPLFSLSGEVSGAINLFLSPFQKESRKYLSKFGSREGAGDEARYNATGVSYYDNDSEFSKLYLTRDRKNSARGMFYINMQEFLVNNSKIYPVLFDRPASSPEDRELVQEAKSAIITNSRIEEIKLYRDRIKKETINLKRERYANDTAYEEPSYLVGTFGDGKSYFGFQLELEKKGLQDTLNNKLNKIESNYQVFLQSHRRNTQGRLSLL